MCARRLPDNQSYPDRTFLLFSVGTDRASAPAASKKRKPEPVPAATKKKAAPKPKPASETAPRAKVSIISMSSRPFSCPPLTSFGSSSKCAQAGKLTNETDLFFDTLKGQLIQKLLCRWWYAIKWPSEADLSKVSNYCTCHLCLFSTGTHDGHLNFW